MRTGACGRLGQPHCCCMADSFLAIRTDGSGWEAMGGMGMMGADGRDGSGWEWMGGMGLGKEGKFINFVTGSEIKGKKR